MSKTATVQFFGDDSHEFKLTPLLIEELERSCGCGIGVLSRRVMSMSFSIRDLTEVIRLGLIGGGTTPERASQLVKTYTSDRPVLEFAPVAVEVLTALMSGNEPTPEAPIEEVQS